MAPRSWATVAELLAALRLNDSTEETAEVTRLHAYASEAVVKHAPEATDTAMNEAARRWAGYLFDMPEAARTDAYSNTMRNSGAARMLLPYRVHRLGLSDAVAEAQAAVGSVSNPVTGLAVQGGQLVVTFDDGSIDALDLPAGMGDQEARDAAAAAQATADANIDAITAALREAIASNKVGMDAQTTADAAQEDITDHETNHPDGTDQVARDSAATAQGTA